MMFYDLNIQRPDTNEEDNLKLIISRAVKFGYKGFAVTTNLDESVFDKNKKEKPKKSNCNETPSVIPLPLDLKVFKTLYPNLYFFNRINIRISDGSNLRKFTQCKNLKKYELVSFQPENQDVLKSLTGIPAINILSFNPINKWDFTFNRKLYNQFVNQNVYFELMYSPGIIDSSARKNLFTVSHMYRAIGKSKNIIVTSGASAPHHIRSPYDVINFNLLFGLNVQQCKASISKNCNEILLKAKGERFSKAAIEMTKLDDPKKEDVSFEE